MVDWGGIMIQALRGWNLWFFFGCVGVRWALDRVWMKLTFLWFLFLGGSGEAGMGRCVGV